LGPDAEKVLRFVIAFQDSDLDHAVQGIFQSLIEKVGMIPLTIPTKEPSRVSTFRGNSVFNPFEVSLFVVEP
jgi:hypothetical protein